MAGAAGAVGAAAGGAAGDAEGAWTLGAAGAACGAADVFAFAVTNGAVAAACGASTAGGEDDGVAAAGRDGAGPASVSGGGMSLTCHGAMSMVTPSTTEAASATGMKRCQSLWVRLASRPSRRSRNNSWSSPASAAPSALAGDDRMNHSRRRFASSSVRASPALAPLPARCASQASSSMGLSVVIVQARPESLRSLREMREVSCGTARRIRAWRPGYARERPPARSCPSLRK